LHQAQLAEIYIFRYNDIFVLASVIPDFLVKRPIEANLHYMA